MSYIDTVLRGEKGNSVPIQLCNCTCFVARELNMDCTYTDHCAMMCLSPSLSLFLYFISGNARVWKWSPLSER